MSLLIRLIRLYYTIFSRVRGGDADIIAQLERENAEDVQAGRRSRRGKESLQDARSKYQFDLLQGDDTANKMMLQ